MNISLDKYTTNTAQITISDIDLISKNKNSITLYYSYQTLIAIRDIDNTYFNTIEPNKDNRLKREVFEKKADKIINQIIFNPYN